MKYQVRQASQDLGDSDTKFYVVVSEGQWHTLKVIKWRASNGIWNKSYVEWCMYESGQEALLSLGGVVEASRIKVLWDQEPERKEFEI